MHGTGLPPPASTSTEPGRGPRTTVTPADADWRDPHPSPPRNRRQLRSVRSGRRARRQLIGWIVVAAAVAWAATAIRLAFTGPDRGTWADVRAGLGWVPTMVSHVPRNFGTLVLVTVLVAAMAGPGWCVLRAFRLVWRSRLERLVVSVAVGLAGWVPLVLVIGTYVGLTSWDVVIPTVIYLSPSLVLAIRWARRAVRTLPRPSWRPARIPWIELALCLVGAAFLYVALLGALQPEVYFDARWYHLGSAAHYVSVGHFYNIVAATHDPAMGLNPYQEISYTGLYAMLGVHGAKLLAFFDLVLIVLGIVEFGIAHLRSARLGLLAAIAFLGLPIASWSATTAYNDLPVALYTLLCAHALARWWSDPARWGWAYVGVGLAAFSLGVKDLGLFTVALTGVVLVVGVAMRPGLRVRALVHLGSAAGVAAAVLVPWWVRAGAMTGNPVFPLVNSVFHSQYWNIYASRAGALGQRHVSLTGMPSDLVRYLWTTVSQPEAFHTLVGPFFLVALPVGAVVALCTVGRPRPILVVLGLGVLAWSGAWYLSALTDSRYLVCIAPLACLLVVGVVADAWARPRVGRAVPVVAMALLAGITLATNPFFTPLERGGQTDAVLGTIGIQWEYLYQHEPEADVQLRWIPIAQYVNSHLPAGSKIYDYAGLNGYYMYIRAEVFNGDGYGSPTVMRQWSLASSDVRSELARNHITDVIVRDDYVPQLMRLAVWPLLRLTYRSPDGLVVFHVL